MRIVLLIADSLQAAAIGPYGNEWIDTPHLNELADASVVFDSHFADSPSLENPSSMRRCRQVFPGAIGGSGDWFKVLQRNDAASEWLITDGSKAKREAIASKIKRLDGIDNGALAIQIRDLLPPWTVAEESLESSFEDWDHDENPEPIVNPRSGLIDAGDDLLRETLQRTYSAAVREFDGLIAWLTEKLSSDDLLIVSAGVGQNIGEHCLVGDDLPWLYEELVHLPLIVRLPGCAHGGRRVSHLTQTLDIGPTILDALGLPVPADWHGSSLLPLSCGGPRIREYVCYGRQVGDRAEFALQTTDEKIIVPQGDPNRRPMYFVKPDDRWDTSDLRQAFLERAEDLERVLLEYIAASDKSGPLVRPALPQSENQNANGETRRREHNQSQSAGGVRRHQGDQEGTANQ